MMTTKTDFSDLSVAAVALEYPTALSVFNRYNIDFCCGGSQSFELACNKAGTSADQIWDEIIENNFVGNPNSFSFTRWSAPLLSDYIVEQHHTYVKEAIPLIQELLEKVCSVHGEAHGELLTIMEKFETLAAELTAHMKKEEVILFPAIKQMATQRADLKLPISVMEDEHEAAGDLIKAIRELTTNYTLPTDACPTYQVTYKKLQEFDQDLMQHIHLENNILFKKAMQEQWN